MVASNAREAQGGDGSPRGPGEGRYQLVRQLGARAVPVFAALAPTPTGGRQLLAVERLPRGGAITDEEAANFVRDARRIAEVDHPNLGRLRDVLVRPREVFLVSDFLDGERLGGLLRPQDSPPLGLELGLRILVDALTGLGALHNLRDAKKLPLKLVHGEITPATIILGVDGSTRLIHACRLRSAAVQPKAPAINYLAPEILLTDAAADPRADVYSVGAILWEMLSGKPLFEESDPQAIVGHIMAGRTPRAWVPETVMWAAALSDVAARALAASPDQRFPHAAAMAAEIRKVAGPKLATVARVAAFMKAGYGGVVAARRVRLETGETDNEPAERTIEAVTKIRSPGAAVDTSVPGAPPPPAPPAPSPPPPAVRHDPEDAPTLDRPLPAELGGATTPSGSHLVPSRPIVLGAPDPISSKEVEAVREMVAAAAKAALAPSHADDLPSSVSKGPIPVPKPMPPQPEEPSIMVSDEIKDEVTQETRLGPKTASARATYEARRALRRKAAASPAPPPVQPSPPPPQAAALDEGERATRPAPMSVKTPIVAMDPQEARKLTLAAEPTPMAVPIPAREPAAADEGPMFPDLPPMRAQLPTSPSVVSINMVLARQRRTRRAVAFVSGGMLVLVAGFAWRSFKLHENRISRANAQAGVLEAPVVAAKPLPSPVQSIAPRPTSPAPDTAPPPLTVAATPAPTPSSSQPVAAAEEGTSKPARPSRTQATTKGESGPAPTPHPAPSHPPRPARSKVFDPTAI